MLKDNYIFSLIAAKGVSILLRKVKRENIPLFFINELVPFLFFENKFSNAKHRHDVCLLGELGNKKKHFVMTDKI